MTNIATNIKRITATLIAASMLAGTLAQAQPRGHDDRDGRDGRGDRGRGEQMDRGSDRGDRDHGDRHDDRRGRDMHRGAGPNHNYYRGGRLPPAYRTQQYVVRDWRGRHLNAPPRGYQWVQTGTDFLLVAVATGIIAQVLLNN